MKKIVLSIAFVICLINLSQAQLKIGAKVGGMLSSLTSQDQLDQYFAFVGVEDDFYKTKLSYQLGGFLQLKLKEKFVLQPELLWSNKGSTIDSDRGQGKAHLHYLSLPLLVGYQPVNGLSVLVGPEFSRIISARVKGEDIDNNMDHLLNSDYDIGVNIGLEYQLEKGLGFGVRYNYSINHAINLGYRNSGELNTVQFRNRSIQFYMTYSFLK